MTPDIEKIADAACRVTESAMVAALNQVSGPGQTLSPDEVEALAIGLLRAAAKWWVMGTPSSELADEAARTNFELILGQERKAKADEARTQRFDA